jgi:hypothetical protein
MSTIKGRAMFSSVVRVQQVEGLEDKTDVVPPHQGGLVVIQMESSWLASVRAWPSGKPIC